MPCDIFTVEQKSYKHDSRTKIRRSHDHKMGEASHSVHCQRQDKSKTSQLNSHLIRRADNYFYYKKQFLKQSMSGLIAGITLQLKYRGARNGYSRSVALPALFTNRFIKCEKKRSYQEIKTPTQTYTTRNIIRLIFTSSCGIKQKYDQRNHSMLATRAKLITDLAITTRVDRITRFVIYMQEIFLSQ